MQKLAIFTALSATLISQHSFAMGRASLSSATTPASSTAYSCPLVVAAVPPTPTQAVAPELGSNKPQSYHFPIRAVGSQAVQVTLPAVPRGHLKIKWVPGINASPISGTGTVSVYSQLGVTISAIETAYSASYVSVSQLNYVGSGSGMTPAVAMYTGLLSNGYGSMSAPHSYTGDLSAALSPALGAAPSSVMIMISGAQYDNCRLYGDIYHGGCATTAVYSTHPWQGELYVETDETQALE